MRLLPAEDLPAIYMRARFGFVSVFTLGTSLIFAAYHERRVKNGDMCHDRWQRRANPLLRDAE